MPPENKQNPPTDSSSNPLNQPTPSTSTDAPDTPPIAESPSKTSTQSRKKKLFIGGIAGVVVIAAGLLFLPFSPLSILKDSVPKGPRLTVGSTLPFTYACSVFDNDAVGRELSLNQDKNKQNVEEALAFDPSNTKDASIDLLKLTGRESITSSCKIKFDRITAPGENGQATASFINVSLALQQFPDTQKAVEQFKASKESYESTAKVLPSYKDNSYYVIPVKARSGPTYLQPVIQHKHMLLYLSAPLKADDTKAERMTGQIDRLVKDVVRRIDANEGIKPKNFGSITILGKSKFTDTCQATNLRAVAEAIGGDLQYDAVSFKTIQGYAPTDNNGQSPKYLASVCNFDFRTRADADAYNKLAIPKEEQDATTDYKASYPHYGFLQIMTTEKKEDAQKIIQNFKKSVAEQQGKQGGPKVEDVAIGDAAVKIGNTASELSPYDSKLYYVADGIHAYLISLVMKRQDEPFKTTDLNFEDEQAKKIINILKKADPKP